MRKTRATRARETPPPAVGLEPARQSLRDFAAFLEAQDPEALAAEVTMVGDTLKRCANIQAWFRRYVAALKVRVVH